MQISRNNLITTYHFFLKVMQLTSMQCLILICLFKLPSITQSRVITATILFLQFVLYLSSFVGTLKNEIPGAALELWQLEIEHFSLGILKFSTKH